MFEGFFMTGITSPSPSAALNTQRSTSTGMAFALPQQTGTPAPIAARPITQDQKTQLADETGNLVFGNPQGSQVAYVMTDFNCGYCRGEIGELLQMTAENQDLKVVIKNFPFLTRPSEIYDGRTASQDAALGAAAIAAGPQLTPEQSRAFLQSVADAKGRLDQGRLFLLYAQAAGSDNHSALLQQFPAKTRAETLMPAIEANKTLGDAMGINSTPTVIIDGKILEDRSQLQRYLDEKNQETLDRNVQHASQA
jgi:protein-disulfide isomerase